MKAPRPLHSPSAQTPATLVSSRSSTDDLAALVGFDAGRVEAEVGGVRHAADGQQQVRAVDLGRALGARDADHDAAAAARLDAHALRVEPHAMPSRFEDVADRLRHVVVLAPDQPRRPSRTTVTREPKRRNICANSSPM